MKIVIGYDGSDPARAAISELPRAGLPANAEAVVVSAADVWPQLPSSAFELAPGSGSNLLPMQKKSHALAVESLTEARIAAAEAEKLVKAAFPSWKVSHEAFAGSPYIALTRPELGADLGVGDRERGVEG